MTINLAISDRDLGTILSCLLAAENRMRKDAHGNAAEFVGGVQDYWLCQANRIRRIRTILKEQRKSQPSADPEQSMIDATRRAASNRPHGTLVARLVPAVRRAYPV
jgi:hypothetical protein